MTTVVTVRSYSRNLGATSCDTLHLEPGGAQFGRDLLFVRRVEVRVHQDHGDRLDTLGHRRQRSRQPRLHHRTVGPDPPGRLQPVPTGHEWLGAVGPRVVQRRSGLGARSRSHQPAPRWSRGRPPHRWVPATRSSQPSFRAPTARPGGPLPAASPRSAPARPGIQRRGRDLQDPPVGADNIGERSPAVGTQSHGRNVPDVTIRDIGRRAGHDRSGSEEASTKDGVHRMTTSEQLGDATRGQDGEPQDGASTQHRSQGVPWRSGATAAPEPPIRHAAGGPVRRAAAPQPRGALAGERPRVRVVLLRRVAVRSTRDRPGIGERQPVRRPRPDPGTRHGSRSPRRTASWSPSCIPTASSMRRSPCVPLRRAGSVTSTRRTRRSVASAPRAKTPPRRTVER